MAAATDAQLKDRVLVPEQSLRQTVTAIFEKIGFSREDSAAAADVLIMSELRGVEIQGVSSILPRHIEGCKEGRLNPRPNWRVVRDAPGTATIDGDQGMEIILGQMAMRMAIEKAKRTGVGVVTMFNTGGSGAGGYNAMLALQADMVGLCATAAPIRIVPANGAEMRFGTNPIAFAAPAGKEPPVLFDAATSAVAAGTLRLTARDGQNWLPGWVAETDGTPILKEIPPREMGQYLQLPLGSTREQGSHKGYGLALMVEILATMLTGALPNMLNPGHQSKHHYAAYNIASFTDLDAFKDNMDRMLRTLRETKPAAGHRRVRYPGLSAHERVQERRAHGIPVHKQAIQWFEDTCREMSIPTLKTL